MTGIDNASSPSAPAEAGTALAALDEPAAGLSQGVKDRLEALKRAVVAHNRATLMGATIGWVLCVASVLGAMVMVASSHSRMLAGLLFGFAVVACRRAVHLHRLAVYETGAARRKAAELLFALEQAPDGWLSLADAAARFADADDILDGLEVLGRLDVVFAYTENGEDRLRLDFAALDNRQLRVGL